MFPKRFKKDYHAYGGFPMAAHQARFRRTLWSIRKAAYGFKHRAAYKRAYSKRVVPNIKSAAYAMKRKVALKRQRYAPKRKAALGRRFKKYGY